MTEEKSLAISLWVMDLSPTGHCFRNFVGSDVVLAMVNDAQPRGKVEGFARLWTDFQVEIRERPRRPQKVEWEA